MPFNGIFSSRQSNLLSYFNILSIIIFLSIPKYLPWRSFLVMSGIESVTESILSEHRKESITAIIRIRLPKASVEHFFASIDQLKQKKTSIYDVLKPLLANFYLVPFEIAFTLSWKATDAIRTFVRVFLRKKYFLETFSYSDSFHLPLLENKWTIPINFFCIFNLGNFSSIIPIFPLSDQEVNNVL